MCLYPKLMINKKYTSTIKNGGIVPPVNDVRTLTVPIGCQKCIECKQQKARAWQVRLAEEIRTDNTGQFVTLTFSNESIAELDKDIEPEIDEETGEEITLEGYERDNAIAKLAVKRFLGRWRKKHGKSVKHWLVTEIGGKGTENIHIHGIIFTEKRQDIKDIWQYGFAGLGDYVNEATISYVCKYIMKQDEKHKGYNPRILTSKGIGANYTKRLDSTLNKYTETTSNGGTKETYTTRSGLKINLPIYYRNKIYTDEEKEKLWIEKLDKQIRWVCGTKIDVSTKEGEKEYYRVLKHYQKKNKRLGYGSDTQKWSETEYENNRRNMLRKERITPPPKKG